MQSFLWSDLSPRSNLTLWRQCELLDHFGPELHGIEHWITALDQGTYAAFNMLGKMVPYGNIPFFWTNHYGKGMQYVGNAMSWDEIHIDGVARDNKFIAYYIKDNKVMVFSKSYCPYCTETKKTLDSLGVKAKIIELDQVENGGPMHEALKVICGERTVPQTYIDG